MMPKTNTVAAALATAAAITTEAKALVAEMATVVSHPVESAGGAPASATDPVQGPTPENTPVPGGGRWRWDISKPGWVDLDTPEPAV